MNIDNGLLITTNRQTNTPSNRRQETDQPAFAQVLASTTTPDKKTSNTEIPPSQVSVTIQNYRNDLVNVAKADDREAEALLGYNTQSSFFPLIDISNWPAVHYSVSGELQTPASQAYFAEINASAVQGRTELLQAERAKNTPTAEILDKVLAFNSALPSRFKDMANIFY